MVPPAHAFPRGSCTAALDAHERLLTGFCQTAVVPAAHRASLADAHWLAAGAGSVVEGGPGEIVEGLRPRHELIRSLSEYHGVHRQLVAMPDDEWTLPIVVKAAGAVSLNLVSVRPSPPSGLPALAIVERGVVLEPEAQVHWAAGGISAWTVTRWHGTGEDTEPRYAWVPTPTEPRNEVELIDRLTAAYEGRICRRLSQALREGLPAMRVLVTLSGTQCCGDGVAFLERDEPRDVLAEYPAIARAIEMDTDPDRIPVSLAMNRFAGFRSRWTMPSVCASLTASQA
jgi:hypothetical protein